MTDTNRLITSSEWLGIGVFSGIAYMVAKYGLKERSFDAEFFEAEKGSHYYEFNFEMLDSNGESIDFYVWSSPNGISYAKATKLAKDHAKLVAEKGVEPYSPKPNKKVSKIKFYPVYLMDKSGARGNYKIQEEYSPDKYPLEINLDAESFEADGTNEPITITEVSISNNEQKGSDIRYKVRKVFEKLGYDISPIPKGKKGYTYIRSNSNPVKTLIYNEYVDDFKKALKEQGLKPRVPLGEGAFSGDFSFWEQYNLYIIKTLSNEKIKKYDEIGWPTNYPPRFIEYLRETFSRNGEYGVDWTHYNDLKAESFGAEDSRRRLKELMEGKSKEERKRISKMVQIKGMENTIAELLANAEAFAATTFDEDDDSPKINQEDWMPRTDCEICARPFTINRFGQQLIQHYLKESDNGEKAWKSKKNTDGTRRTARNLAGFFLYEYGLDALNQYVLFQDKTGISDKVIELLRLSLVERVIAGDVVNLIEMMDMGDEVDGEPMFGKKFEEDFGSENN